LSSYPSDLLADYTSKNGWRQQSHEFAVSVNKGSGGGKRKTEVLTCNY
jgi:DNA adenine methylase